MLTDKPADPACHFKRCQDSSLCQGLTVCKHYRANEVLGIARALVQRAADYGQVITIEQVPLQPLAMGNYETVVSVRPAREKA